MVVGVWVYLQMEARRDRRVNQAVDQAETERESAEIRKLRGQVRESMRLRSAAVQKLQEREAACRCLPL